MSSKIYENVAKYSYVKSNISILSHKFLPLKTTGTAVSLKFLEKRK